MVVEGSCNFYVISIHKRWWKIASQVWKWLDELPTFLKMCHLTLGAPVFYNICSDMLNVYGKRANTGFVTNFLFPHVWQGCQVIRKSFVSLLSILSSGNKTHVISTKLQKASKISVTFFFFFFAKAPGKLSLLFDQFIGFEITSFHSSSENHAKTMLWMKEIGECPTFCRHKGSLESIPQNHNCST